MTPAPKPDAILFEAVDPVPFPAAWAAQRRLQRRLLQDPAAAGALLLLEHEPCYTLGRGAATTHLRFDPASPPLPLHRIDRGGEVTHHLPGQLVLYPVLNLQRHGGDLHLYLRLLEQVVIDLLATLGLEAGRIEGLTGVWLEGRKLAAIGVGARRWISQHGLALNVDCSLEGFSAIVPCGIPDRPVGRLADWRPELTAADLRQPLLARFAERFQLRLRPPTAQETLEGW
ncbi:lipoyl(octanoyl) transferase LipB [Cyanobium sp. CH-040]|uniref:lipoyl(octanoyl) transferase LipB n=1 Tax=Cyanobium sp. CH-040 TaxID=2823708 RepID=UPI0020CE6B91|nr:lipoyl(octanoyl) transferase LipB [Cyanobium sp. CH-040]MCP9928708.1 lipoyl(octanoyl) transferase LipB [Cyanobium sp. CH-040]